MCQEEAARRHTRYRLDGRERRTLGSSCIEI